MTTLEQLQQDDNFRALITQQAQEARDTLTQLHELYDSIYQVKRTPIVDTHKQSAKEFTARLGQWRKARSQFITAEILHGIWQQAQTREEREAAIRPLLVAAEDVRMHQGRSVADFEHEVMQSAGGFYNAAVKEFDTVCPHYNAVVKAVNKQQGEKPPSRRDFGKFMFAAAAGGTITSQATNRLSRSQTKQEAKGKAIGSFSGGALVGMGLYELAITPKPPQNRREFEELSNALSVVYQRIEKRELDHARQSAKAIEGRMMEYVSGLPDHFGPVEAALEGEDKALWEGFRTNLSMALKAQPNVSEDEPLGHYARVAKAYQQQNEHLAAVYAQFQPVMELVVRHTQREAAPGKLSQQSSRTSLTIIGHLQECCRELMDTQENIVARAENMALYAHQPNIGVTR